MEREPYQVLGLRPDAALDEIEEARRRLAIQHHPDRGGDAALMQEINAAADALLRRRTMRGAADASTGGSVVTPPRDGSAGRMMRVAHDVPSFTVEALPAVTFEALLIVASWMGEVLDDDPPYRLDAYLHTTLDAGLGAPLDCWCRLDIVPDAGASTVSIAVGGLDGAPPPDVDVVRDAWIANLNALDWPESP